MKTLKALKAMLLAVIIFASMLLLTGCVGGNENSEIQPMVEDWEDNIPEDANLFNGDAVGSGLEEIEYRKIRVRDPKNGKVIAESYKLNSANQTSYEIEIKIENLSQYQILEIEATGMMVDSSTLKGEPGDWLPNHGTVDVKCKNGKYIATATINYADSPENSSRPAQIHLQIVDAK